MAGSPQTRVRFTTDKALLRSASTVALNPPVDMAVFYAEDEGAVLAAQFVKRSPDHTRLNELLQATPQGRDLWARLMAVGRPWSDQGPASTKPDHF